MRSGVPLAGGPAVLVKARTVGQIWEIASELFKLRLTSAVVLTTMVSFYMGSVGRVDVGAMVDTLMATALLACGAAAFNELLEREQDAKMHRTELRPLPAKKLSPRAVFGLSAVISGVGLLYLTFAVSTLVGLIGLATIGSYLLCYTPMKRISALNTLVGAIPGALPAMIGWAAGRGTAAGAGWALFAIVFLWQIPHFLAIGWMYREDYARAGFRILAMSDPDGSRSGRHAMIHSACLIWVSFCPFLLGIAGRLYLFGALVLGTGMLLQAIRFARAPSGLTARKLFLSSVLYLPVLFILMAIGKAVDTGW